MSTKAERQARYAAAEAEHDAMGHSPELGCGCMDGIIAELEAERDADPEVTRATVRAAEDAARAHLELVERPEREGWSCADHDPDDDDNMATWLWHDGPDGTPLCDWHASERVHEAIPYGANCSRCGKDHAALWPDGQPLFDDDEPEDTGGREDERGLNL